MKETIHVFDVDGTITNSDSFIGIIKHFTPSTITKIFICVSVFKTLVKDIFKRDFSKTKLNILSFLWKGSKRNVILLHCNAFFNEKMKRDIKLEAFVYIINLKEQKPAEKIVLLSASCSEWLTPLSDFLEADLICTELVYNAQQIFIGQFATPNCKGQEKVKRLLEKYPAKNYEFICYGNNKSDKKLEPISKTFYYRYF